MKINHGVESHSMSVAEIKKLNSAKIRLNRKMFDTWYVWTLVPEFAYERYWNNYAECLSHAHREDGPAIFRSTKEDCIKDGREQYYLFGKEFANIEEWKWCVKHLDKLEITPTTITSHLDPKLMVEHRLKFT